MILAMHSIKKENAIMKAEDYWLIISLGAIVLFIFLLGAGVFG